MGDTQAGGDSDALPVHEVQIKRPFAIGRYEVTFEEYDQFAEATDRRVPSDEGWGRGRRPVIKVTWDDAVDYVIDTYAITGDVDTCRKYLHGYGAWDDDELSDHEQNLKRLVWLAGGNLREADDEESGAVIYFAAY